MTSEFPQFRMALMQFVSQLTMVPVPPPGSLGIVRSCFCMSLFVFVLSNISCGQYIKVQCVYSSFAFDP